MRDIVCPKCGSDYVNTAAYDGSYPIEEYKMFICQECYHEFNPEERAVKTKGDE